MILTGKLPHGTLTDVAKKHGVSVNIVKRVADGLTEKHPEIYTDLLNIAIDFDAKKRANELKGNVVKSGLIMKCLLCVI